MQTKREACGARFIKNEDVKHARASSGVGAWGRSPIKSAEPGGDRGVWVSLWFEESSGVLVGIRGAGGWGRSVVQT